MSQREPFRSGFVALVGRPNVGKSTLLNRLVSAKVAIVTDKPQTTRHQIRGVLTLADAQIVFVDTPGLHKSQDHLGDQLNLNVKRALRDVDVALVLVDAAAGVGRGDEFVAAEVGRSPAKALLALNKVDAVDGAVRDEQFSKAAALGVFEGPIAISAVDGTGIDKLVRAVVGLLPPGPKYYPDEDVSDQPIEVMVAELIREKALTLTREEVPHSIGVDVESIAKRKGRSLFDVDAAIVVERPSQKGIVIGKGGALIREIGQLARPEVETLLGAQVYLSLKVKVRKDWRKDERSLRAFGYLSE